MIGTSCAPREWREPTQGNGKAYKEDTPQRGCREKYSLHLKFTLSEFQETGTCFKEIWACFQKQDPFIDWGGRRRRRKEAGWGLLWMPWFSKFEARSQVQALLTARTMKEVEKVFRRPWKMSLQLEGFNSATSVMVPGFGNPCDTTQFYSLVQTAFIPYFGKVLLTQE